MQTKEYKSLGFTVPFNVPSSTEEYNQNATKNGVRKGNPCLDDAVDNVIYRGSLTEFRDTLLHGKWDGEVLQSKGVEQITGIKRKTKVTGKTKSGEDIIAWAETEADYLDRVLVETKKERAEFQPLATTVAKAIEFDASGSERKPKAPTKLADKYKVAAKALLAGKNIARFLGDVLKNTGYSYQLTNDAEKDIEGVGRAVKAHSEWLLKAAEEKALKQYA